MVLTSINACKIKLKKLMTTKEKKKQRKVKSKQKQNKQNNKYKSTKFCERPEAKKICALTSSVEPIDKDNYTQSSYSNRT